MTKNKLAAMLISTAVSALAAGAASAAGDAEGQWRIYSKEPNGDVYFFDPTRVSRTNELRRAWSRARYKTSVMGAASYQSLLEIDCSKRTEKIVQNTFFSDKSWERPAMNTDTMEKPKRLIVKGSATERLYALLCDE